MSDGKFLPRPFRFRKHLIINRRGREKRVGKQKLCAKMKHITFTFLLTVLLSMAGAKSFAQSFVVGGINYNVTSGNEVEVAPYNRRYSGDIVIPETVNYDGTVFSVTAIGNEAFSKCYGLTSIVIPNTVKRIGRYAFYRTEIKSVTIGNSVTNIEYMAFRECDNLTSVTIPNSVTTIDNEAFESCDRLVSVVFGNNVATIGTAAFNGCSALTSITIPKSVATIGGTAFGGCNALSSIAVEPGNPVFDSRDNCNAIIETSANILISGCKSTIIPNGVVEIGYAAFHNIGITSIDIPNSVTNIGDGAFSKCSSLTSIVIPNSVTRIGASAFQDCSMLTSIVIPNSVTDFYYGVFDGCTSLTTIIVEPGNPLIDSRDNCNAIILTSSNRLFLGCKGTIIPNSVTTIGDASFSGCTGLTTITIPNSVTSIDAGAFSGCTGLTSITIPTSVTNIGVGAFYNCSSLTSIIIPNSVTTIENQTFQNCNSLTSVTIPNSVTSIGNYAFADCSTLNSVVIPNSVTTIGNSVFSKCIGLKDVTIGNGLTSTGQYTFSDCSGLTTVTIGNCVTSIGSSAFSRCTSLSSVTIPNSVTEIENDAFNRCESLTSLTIGSSVSKIGSNVFFGSALSHITSLATVPPYCTGATFNDINKSTCRLSVPEGSVDAYKAANEWKDFYNIDGEATGIESMTKNADAKAIESIYDLNGQLQQGLRHGLNIVRMSDGTVRKTMMK